MEALEAETAGNDRLWLWIAFDYGGRAELVDAARRLLESGARPEDLDEDALGAQLYAPELPDPDLLIRTSGELRLELSSGSSPTRSSSSSRRSGRTSARTTCAGRSPTTRPADAGSAAGDPGLR